MKTVCHALGVILNIVFYALIALILVSTIACKAQGKTVYILGYRPVYVLSGSMEPTLKTHGVVINKKLSDSDKLQAGDMVTYHETIDGNTIEITHRIVKISDDGTIVTKGDNNDEADAFAITRENVDDRVVFVWNWVARIVSLWSLPTGKITIIGTGALALFLLFVFGPAEKGEKKEADAATSAPENGPKDEK